MNKQLKGSSAVVKPADAAVVSPDEELFGRVATILDHARVGVVRAVNHHMVVAYWLIGREIVMELQRGQERAGYGERLVQNLSVKLTLSHGAGYSVGNLWLFKKFYSAYESRGSILYTACTELQPIETMKEAVDCAASAFRSELSWSHYRILMRVQSIIARDYYEAEAASSGWTVRELERQIHTQYYQRHVATSRRQANAKPAEGPLSTPGPKPVRNSDASLEKSNPIDALKDPYVMEFLDIPDAAALHEKGLEGAIIGHLRDFLLELGRGFAFVARQKRLSFDGDEMYVDLVFYNCILKCYLLIDLKTGRLSAADVGQMDSYVRMFDDLVAGDDDNPTIGLILCTERNNAVARYSVLNDRHQIFASRYMTCLPTEAELAAEVERERRLFESPR